jgi:hypothetical protein
LRVSSASRETSSIRSAFVISLLLPWGRCRLAVRRAPAYNLLKFKGFYASGEVGTREKVLSSLFSVLRNTADSHY